MGNRYAVRRDEFDWSELGVRRRLRRYLREACLSYSEAGLLLGCSRGSVAYAAKRYGLALGTEVQREMMARQSWERAKHGRRAYEQDWDSKLTETWEERKKRRAREAADAKAT